MRQRSASSERCSKRGEAAATHVDAQAGAAEVAADSASLLLARSLAFVCKNLCSEANQLLTIGRFDLLRTLGRGGMGVVYEAYDPLRRERLALKTLYGRTPEDLYRLKREFRSLAALRHENLVALHELSVAEGEAHFTMELVSGCDFLSYVRDGQAEGAPPSDLTKLRGALAQLAAGVNALHRAGKLHGDLKPSNVLVNGAGRVVLLDFGLVRDARDRDDVTSGTLAYMAPEQAAGSPCESSDWYSFGLILKQALYGRGELRARPRVASDARSSGDQVRALEQLATALTERDAAQRPRFRDIEALVDPAPRAFAASPNAPRNRGFIGRAAELESLARAFTESKSAPVIFLVRGESGIGKSALLRRFIDSALDTDDALVFSGRCYERESIPFKALDEIVDRLSHHLAALPEAEARALCPVHANALVRLFPVLGRIAAFARSSGALADVHPVELRRRGGEALRELFCELAARRPLVLSIDDIQWSDADSGQLLAAILCDERAPPMLVLGSDRSDPWQINPAVSAFQRASELSACGRSIAELILDRLTEADAESLAHELLDEPHSGGAALVRFVVSESAGNPLLLTELARTLGARADGALPLEHSSLASLFAERLRQLDAQSRLLLELVVVAGRPVPLSTLARAAELERLPYAEVAALRTARLVHVLPRDGDELLELDHDRVSEAVLREVDAGARKVLHTRLARAFEAAEGDHDDVLFEQYLGADLRTEAAQHARKAADAALALLAFSRAAWLYEQALNCAAWSAKEQGQMQRDLAAALDHSGRALEAAVAYQRAAALHDDPKAVRLLEERAARHLLHNGRAEEGLALLQRGFVTLGLHWPASRAGLLLGLARQLLPAPLRRFSLRRDRTSAAVHLARAEYLAEAGRGVEGYDQLRSMYNALVCVDAAEQSGCPIWQTRAAGGRAFFRCLALAPGAAECALRELERACVRADELGDVHARADLGRQLACAHFLFGNPRTALELANRNESLLRSLPLVAYDLHIVMSVIGSALLDLGAIHELRRRWTAFTHAAQQHGDAMTAFWIHAHPVQFALFFANGDRRGAELALESQAKQQTLLESYSLLAWVHAFGRIETELYWGSARTAVALARAERRTLLRSGQPFLTTVARHFSARANIALASSLPPGRKRARLLRCAEREAARVERPMHSRRGSWLMLQADIALLRGDPQGALKLLDLALVELERGGHELLAACALHCRGALIAGENGANLQREALTAIAELGVAEPLRWVLWMAPAFRCLNDAAPRG